MIAGVSADVVATVAPGTFRLLVISSDTYPPTRVDVSVLFGEELASRGHQIDWILQSEAECKRGYVTPWGRSKVWVTPADRGTQLLSRIRKHVLGVIHDIRLFGLLRTGQYDAIEVKDKFLSGVFALIAAKLYDKKFIFWLSYPFPEHYKARARDGTAPYPWLYRLRGAAFGWLLYRLLLPRADHIFVQSEQMRRDIHAEGIPLTKLTAVPMGMRTTGASAAPTAVARRIPAGQRNFLYLGSLGRERRIDFLLRVLNIVGQKMPDVKLYLVGKAEHDDDEMFLRTEARRLDVEDRVIFVGQLPQPEALQYVREADVCVSPFFNTPILNSTSPTKLVEYMAMGKPVVANTHPEQQLVIEESGGGYCVPYDEQAFADAIIALLQSPDSARIMGENGRRYVHDRRSYGKIADRVERELQRVLARADR